MTQITTAMILAAGLGTRMRPLSLETPKPLIKVNGKALIDYMLDPLVNAGVTKCIVNVHWLADQVEAHISARQDGVEYIISDERAHLLETGGGLAKARPHLGNDPIFVANTDAFWGSGSAAPLKALMTGFDPQKMDVLLLLADKNRSLGYHGQGDFSFNKDQAQYGKLGRRGDAPSAPYAFTGVRIINPKIYDNAPIKPFSSNVIWNAGLLFNGRVHGHVLDDFWLHVGDPTAMQDAQSWLACF